jgi:hypothetical protein
MYSSLLFLLALGRSRRYRDLGAIEFNYLSVAVSSKTLNQLTISVNPHEERSSTSPIPGVELSYS